MDFQLTDDQREIVAAVEGLLAQHAGAPRAIALGAKADYDHALESALDDAGFLDVGLGEGTGWLEAALVVEAVARAAGVAAVGAAALVAPGLLGRRLPGPIALACSGDRLVPFAGHARSLLLDAGEEARWVSLAPGDCEPVPSSFMLPVARPREDLGDGEALGPGSGENLRSFWRVALAAECVGLMSAALDVTVEYVKQRRQFGRAIGSFQAIQHRLALCKVGIEGARWLTYEAAAKAAPMPPAAKAAPMPRAAQAAPMAAATAPAAAAAHAVQVAQQVFIETHQITGAMGFTREHDLHVWSMRLEPLILAGGGASAHARAVAETRWKT